MRTTPRRGKIAIAGALAQRPGHGGHAWVFLQYLLGFRRLGWDVLFLDELSTEMCVDEQGRQTSFEQSWNLRYFRNVMRQFGLEESFSIRFNDGGRTAGMAREDALRFVRDSAFLLNVMGFLHDPEILDTARRRVFLDIDPGFGQIWRELGQADVFAGHDDFITIGLNIGSADCIVPTCGLKWITTVQPIVLEHWPAVPIPPRGPITTIASWRGPFGPIEYHGTTYGLRVHEFRKFLELPRLIDASFEVALDIHPADSADIEKLASNGWRQVDPRIVAKDPMSYQRYIAQSRAEFMVAKNLYVQSRGGWFSDRSICYLATGRPVLAQDTGIHNIPTGEGLLTFSTVQEAVAGFESILQNPAHHSRAARSLAETHFDSDKVLGRLLEELSVI